LSLLLASQQVVPLTKAHDRAGFDCDNPELNRYLRQQARQDAERHVAAPFVLVQPGSNAVFGYYTLSASVIAMAELSPELMRKLPRYGQLPVILLGRLAVDAHAKGQGVGEFLLVDALRRSWQHARQLGAMAVTVDAKDAQAESFYRYFNFLPYQLTPLRLYLPMRHVAQLFPDQGDAA
jgi:GNAT superfamily N-acetyltransferase